MRWFGWIANIVTARQLLRRYDLRIHHSYFRGVLPTATLTAARVHIVAISEDPNLEG